MSYEFRNRLRGQGRMLSDPAMGIVKIEVPTDAGSIEEAKALFEEQQAIESEKAAEDIAAAAVTPEQAVAQVTQMTDGEYEAYMLQLKESDPAYFDSLVELINKNNGAESLPRADVVVEDVAPTPKIPASKTADVVTLAPAAPKPTIKPRKKK